MISQLRGISRIVTVVIVVVILVVAASAGYLLVSNQTGSTSSSTGSSTTSSNNSGASTTISSASIVAPSSIVIGCAADLSGSLSALNIPSHGGSVAAEQYVNTVLGGVYVKEFNKKIPVQLLCYDDQSIPSNALSIVQNLVSQNVTALLGPSGSPVVTAYISTVQTDKIPLLVTGAFADTIWDKNYSYAYCQCPLASAFANLVESEVLKQIAATGGPKFTTAAVVYDGVGNANQQIQGEGYTALLKSMGVNVFFNDSIPTGQASYATVIQQIAADKPQFLIADIEDVPTAVEFMKELTVQGVHPEIIQTYPQGPGSLQSFGPDIVGTIGDISWIPAVAPVNESGVAQQLSFFQNYSKAQGWSTAVEDASAGGFGSFMTVVDAIQAAGTLDHAAIAQALGNTYYTIWGPYHPVGSTHTLDYWPAILGQVQVINGTAAVVPIYPPGAPGTYSPIWSSA